jgi:hypothetical protein
MCLQVMGSNSSSRETVVAQLAEVVQVQAAVLQQLLVHSSN